MERMRTIIHIMKRTISTISVTALDRYTDCSCVVLGCMQMSHARKCIHLHSRMLTGYIIFARGVFNVGAHALLSSRLHAHFPKNVREIFIHNFSKLPLESVTVICKRAASGYISAGANPATSCKYRDIRYT